MRADSVKRNVSGNAGNQENQEKRGAAFGAPDCLRFSYATSDEKLIEAMGRVKAAVEKLR